MSWVIVGGLFGTPITTLAQTADEWVALGQQVHGGFGSYIALGLRIGLDARTRLQAGARELDVTYQDGISAPCACVVDGIMLATVATPGQNSLRVRSTKCQQGFLGVAIITHKKTGKAIRYEIPVEVRSRLDAWNQEGKGRSRYDAVMNAPQDSLFQVKPLE